MSNQKSLSHKDSSASGNPPPCLQCLGAEITKISTALQSAANISICDQGDNSQVKNNGGSHVGANAHNVCLEDTFELLPNDEGKKNKQMETTRDCIQAIRNLEKRKISVRVRLF